MQVIDKSFGFDTAVEEAQRAINAAHVEAESAENGIGVVKLMGRNSGTFINLPIQVAATSCLFLHHCDGYKQQQQALNPSDLTQVSLPCTLL